MRGDDFEQFLVEHLPRLRHLARTLAVQSGVDHHELLSGTPVTLHRRWATIVPPIAETRRAFARALMLNLVRSEERRAHARREAPTSDLQVVLDRTLGRGPGDDPAFAAVCREDELKVYRAIKQLPALDRTIMMLVVQELSWRETAQALGIDVAEVRNGVLRARRRLRELRKEDDDD